MRLCLTCDDRQVVDGRRHAARAVAAETCVQVVPVGLRLAVVCMLVAFYGKQFTIQIKNNNNNDFFIK